MKPKTVINIFVGLLGAIIIYHFLILLKVIPYEVTWGGRLKNDSEMYIFEGLSILLNSFLLWLLLIKGGQTKPIIPIRVVNIVLWLFLILFLLNTVGNIFAKTNFEKLFALITLLFTVFLWMILRPKGQK